MTSYELALSIAVPALQTGVLLLMFLRHAIGPFRAFFAYTAFAVVSGVVKVAVFRSEALYFNTYWASEAGYTVLKFLALEELFRNVFASFYSMKRFRVLFPAIGAWLLGAAVLRNALHRRPEEYWLTATIISSEIAIGILQIGLFGLFLALVRFFRVRWRQQPFGIAFGFGLAAAGSLIPFLLRSEFGTKFDNVVRMTPPITYTLAVIVWLVTFLTRQPEAPQPGTVSGLTPEGLIADLRRYTAVVKRIFRQ